MQNNSGQPKNEKSTARKTRPTLVEKMAMLEEIMQGWAVALLFLQLFPALSINQSINPTILDWKIHQSINQWINRTIINWKILREFILEIFF